MQITQQPFTIWTNPERIKGDPVAFPNGSYGSVYMLTVLFRVYYSAVRYASSLMIYWGNDRLGFYEMERRGN